MTQEDRLAQASKIMENASQYKVCEGCESIVKASAITCPNCHGYRFDPSSDRVVAQARFLGSRERTSVLSTDLES
ncbi:MAG: hypothetical protein SFY92_03520 [Verrucomicrobiae bacterium]|nr:hypothetical protein [Verrucomicrobiae bacterium]